MTVELSSLTGVRQAITVVLPVQLPDLPSWAEGPLPFELGSRRTDTLTRQTYFTPAAARVLYGTRSDPADGTVSRTSRTVRCTCTAWN